MSSRYSPLHYGVREIVVLAFFFLVALFLVRKVGPFSLAQSLWELPLNYDGILAPIRARCFTPRPDFGL